MRSIVREAWREPYSPGTRLTTCVNVRIVSHVAKSRFNFFIDDSQRIALQVIQERDGILPSEQIRRALDDWIEKKNIAPKGERKRGPARRRS